jgi:hypothetical protein
MDKHNVYEKKSTKIECILYYSIHIEFKNQPNECVQLDVKIMVFLGQK